MKIINITRTCCWALSKAEVCVLLNVAVVGTFLNSQSQIDVFLMVGEPQHSRSRHAGRDGSSNWLDQRLGY